jgi:hypothetical protein
MAQCHQSLKLIHDKMWQLMGMGEGVANGFCLFCFCILFIASYCVMAWFVLRQCSMFDVLVSWFSLWKDCKGFANWF